MDVRLRDGTLVNERWACHCQDCESHPQGPMWAEERYSMGIYAGRMCDLAWANSGFIDAGPEAFDPDYAGERYDEDY
jgi:hypothetical protein